MEKILNNKEIETNKEEVFASTLKKVANNLEWIDANVNQTKILVTEAPKKEDIAGQNTLNFDGSISDYVDSLESSSGAIISDREAADDCYYDSRRFVVLDNKQIYPTFWTAQKGLLDRRGCNCPAITGNYLISRPIASIEELFLNDSAARNKGTEKWGYLDGGMMSNVSASYVPLNCYEGYEVFLAEINKEWEDIKFSYGILSYEGYLCDYEINDDIALDGLKNILTAQGINVDSISAVARYTTSDSTLSAMAGDILYKINGVTLHLNTRIGVNHIGDVSIETFKNKIAGLGMLLKEAEDRIENLGNLEIENPKECLENALKKVSLYNRVGKQAVENLDLSISFSALDIYIKVNEVCNATSNIESWSQAKSVEQTEIVSRLLNANFNKLDKIS